VDPVAVLALERLELQRLRPDAEHLVAHHGEVRVLLHERREDIQHRVGVVLGGHGSPPYANT
jgi:hypothetical protein